ncbi:MAG: NAD(P)-dependent oxidoreductase [Anaerolineae bacterium]
MQQTVLVTGAAGAVGSAVLAKLLARRSKLEVRALDVKTKRSQHILKPYAKDVEVHWGDLRVPASFEAAVRGVDAVIHLAAIIPPLADHQPALAEAVNVEGTRNLIEALQRNAPDAFLLYTSSVSVYGDRVATPWITVTDPLCPSDGDYYAVTKIKAEEMVKQSGLKWSVFRLTGIFSPTTSVDPLLFHMPLDTCLEFATTRDTGRALVYALDRTAQLIGRTFNLAGGARCRVIYRDFLEQCFSQVGLGRLDFPCGAFAERNFHCGYFTDSDELERILHFQRDSVESYLAWRAQFVPSWQRRLASGFKAIIKQQLLKRSDPYRALKERNSCLIKRFFGETRLKRVA